MVRRCLGMYFYLTRQTGLHTGLTSRAPHEIAVNHRNPSFHIISGRLAPSVSHQAFLHLTVFILYICVLKRRVVVQVVPCAGTCIQGMAIHIMDSKELYEGDKKKTKQNWNYLLKGRPLVVQASPH